ncbi:MAG: hypothetical protein NTY22_09790 [Proteobacteria bacterium]|nr:hypothetical protein [Pseudomonadota bacterium]
MKQILFLLIFCSCNIFAQAPTQEELCSSVNYDYNHHFGPERDEGTASIAYASSVADLISEDLYLKLIGTVPNSFFENNISAVDVQRCDMEQSYGLGSLSSNSYFAMDCALYRGGACLEKYAISDTKSVTSFTGQKGRFDYFMSVFNDWLDIKTDKRLSDKYIAEKILEFWKYLPKDSGYSVRHFNNAFHNAKNSIHFLSLLLITDDCKKGRFQFPNRELVFVNFYNKKYSSVDTYKEKTDIIKNALLHKRSLIVTLLDSREEEKKAAASTAIISGLRMNDGTCEIYLRNSLPWWAVAPLVWHNGLLHSVWKNGWHNADDILPDTLSLRYLKEVEPIDYENAKEDFLKKNINDSYDEKKEDVSHHKERW